MENGYVCFILNDAESTVIKLPFVSETELSMSVEPGTLKNNISAGQERTLLRLKISGNVNDADIKFIRYYMTNLEYLDLSETQLVSIPLYAFEGMTRIKEVVLPKTCNNVGDKAFQGCRILCSVSAPGAGSLSCPQPSRRPRLLCRSPRQVVSPAWCLIFCLTLFNHTLAVA